MEWPEVWIELHKRWKPDDPFQPSPEAERHYKTKFGIARELHPESICEIGVRCGYSMFIFKCAVPDVKYTGIDSHIDETVEGHQGESEHAEKIRGSKTTFIHVDSQKLEELPTCDLLHIDGDHSYKGCRHDLELGKKSALWILVDDFDSDSNVREACRDFLLENQDWRGEYIPDGFRGNLLLTDFTVR